MVAKLRKELVFFKKITAIPYLLVFLALLMPLANVSCSSNENDSETVAKTTLYQLASGLTLEQALTEPAAERMKQMVDGNPRAMEKLKKYVPEFPKIEMPLYVIFIAILFAAVFSWFTPLGSAAMGLLSMISLWALVSRLAHVVGGIGIPVLKVEPGAGIYCASFLLIIGTAMNLSTIVRGARENAKQKRLEAAEAKAEK